MKIRWIVQLAVALARHPELWGTAIRQAVVLTPNRWWRRAPFLPVPDAQYMRFRLLTAYGDPGHAPESADVIAYLHWCRAWPRL